MSDETRRVDPEALADIVQRTAEAAAPDRIVILGSAARGRMGRNSDVAPLAAKPGANRPELA
jgi:predicted nucleotidyltransferase